MILKVARLCLISLKSFPQNDLSQFINNERLLVVHWNTPPDASRWINSSQKEFPQHSTHLTPDENILLFLQPCVKLSRKTFLDESQRHKVVSSPYTDTLVILEKLKKPLLPPPLSFCLPAACQMIHFILGCLLQKAQAFPQPRLCHRCGIITAAFGGEGVESKQQ